MAAINFATDLTPKWGLNTSGDAAFVAVDAKHKSTVQEQNILVLVDVVRAYMDTLKTGSEARVARQLLNRMAAEIMTSSGGYATPANVTAASGRARDAALAYYQRHNIDVLVEDANPTLDPNVVFE